MYTYRRKTVSGGFEATIIYTLSVNMSIKAADGTIPHILVAQYDLGSYHTQAQQHTHLLNEIRTGLNNSFNQRLEHLAGVDDDLPVHAGHYL